MKWYFGLSEASITRADHGWKRLVTAAVVSALQNTDLSPNLLYDGTENAFISELRQLGVNVIHHRVSFYDALKRRGDAYLPIASGAFLRVEIPVVETEEDYVLYTDCDVMFRRHPEIWIKPALFAAAPETSLKDYVNNMNSGVMWMNVPALRADLPRFIDFICAQLGGDYPGFDQENYRRFYAGQWDYLDVIHNWKPYWGPNSLATILHWHGPKPPFIRRVLVDRETPTNPDWRRLFELNPDAYKVWLDEWDRLAIDTSSDIIGHVDHFDGTHISGWALLKEDPVKPIVFDIEIDSRRVGAIDCSGGRPDLISLGAMGLGGFSYDIPRRFRDGQSHLLRLSCRGSYCALGWRGGRHTDFQFCSHNDNALPIEDDFDFTEGTILTIDDVTPESLSGWAVNKSRPDEPVEFRLIVDGKFVAHISCDEARPDVKASGMPEFVGFSYRLDPVYFDNQTHTLQAQAIDGNWILLHVNAEEVTKYEFRQRWRPRVYGHVDGNREGVIKGWVLYDDMKTGAKTGGGQILVTCDGVQVAQIRATSYRPDVAKYYASTPECGFVFVPPPAFRRSRQQSFRFLLLPFEIELEGSPCVTSFANDSQQGELAELSEIVDRLHRDLTRLRRQMRLVLPRPIYSLEDYHSWAIQYLAGLRNIATYRRPALSRPQNRHDNPLISIVCPTYKPVLTYFRQAVDSVLLQTYQNWELLIIDDGSADLQLSNLISEFARKDARVRYLIQPNNCGISEATNVGIDNAHGEWVVFFDHDDLLVDVAIEIMVASVQRSGAKVAYSDEDKIDGSDRFSEPALKPDWNYRLALSVNYVSHLLMVEKALLKATGPLKRQYDGAQDHDLLLRLTEQVSANEILHVPEILYHWRKSDNSTASSTGAKAYAIEAGVSAISDHLARRGKSAIVSSIANSTWYNIKWQFVETPSVTIIIPFKEAVDITRECVDRILSTTSYHHYDVIIVDNWSTSVEASEFCTTIRSHPNVSVIRVEEGFNYSRLNNIAAATSDADFFVLMNNDLFVKDPDWLQVMLGEALADDTVAIVGGKFLYPNGTIQHGGVVTGVGGVATHVHTGLPADAPGYAGRALFAQEYSAVTAACLLIRSEVFREVGGLDEENLSVAFNDVDLCLKVRKNGWKVIWTPDFLADHHESLSRGDDERQEYKEARFFDEMQFMITKWGETLKHDPFYSKHFLLDGRPFFDLVPPAQPSRAPSDVVHDGAKK